MKKILFSAFVFLWTCTSFSQTNYEKGYYLDNQGNKNEGYFKIIDFEDINEKSFKSLDFKKELSQETTELSMENITEFGIAQDIKYQKISVQMDDVNLKGDFDGSKDLDLKPSILFLNVLVEGNANLYAFDSDNMTKYFYKINDKDNKINQLVYKKYLNSEGGLVENAYFRQQMFNNVKCENQTFNEFLNINYNKDKLVSFFENFNECRNSHYVVYKNKLRKEAKFNLTAFAGGYLGYFNMENVYPATTSTSKGIVGLGIDAELLLPSEKWSFFAKLEYSSIKADVKGTGSLSESNNTVVADTYHLDSGFLDFVLGTRWYHGFNKEGKIFLGAGVGINSPFGTIVKDHNLTIPNDPNYSVTITESKHLAVSPYINFEIGYKFNKHFGVAAIVDSNNNLLGNEKKFKTQFFRSGLNLRYTF